MRGWKKRIKCTPKCTRVIKCRPPQRFFYIKFRWVYLNMVSFVSLNAVNQQKTQRGWNVSTLKISLFSQKLWELFIHSLKELFSSIRTWKRYWKFSINNPSKRLNSAQFSKNDNWVIFNSGKSTDTPKHLKSFKLSYHVNRLQITFITCLPAYFKIEKRKIFIF